jgi:hypothetical protein
MVGKPMVVFTLLSLFGLALGPAEVFSGSRYALRPPGQETATSTPYSTLVEASVAEPETLDHGPDMDTVL